LERFNQSRQRWLTVILASVGYEGWTAVSMENDWKGIFAFDKVK